MILMIYGKRCYYPWSELTVRAKSNLTAAVQERSDVPTPEEFFKTCPAKE
jgi:hypothetical protein